MPCAGSRPIAISWPAPASVLDAYVVFVAAADRAEVAADALIEWSPVRSTAPAYSSGGGRITDVARSVFPSTA
jgi:hypothetical protein